jgi:hypothetical protein
MTTSFTLYAQQALESCPCPHCGAYTLTCRDQRWGALKLKTARIPEKRAG